MEEPGVQNNKTPPTELKSQSPASTSTQAQTAERIDAASAPPVTRPTGSGASSEEPSAHRPKQENGVSHDTEGASSRRNGGGPSAAGEQADKDEQTPPM